MFMIGIDPHKGSHTADKSAPPNFGHFGVQCEPREWLTDRRLPMLLRLLADQLEEDQRNETEWSRHSEDGA